MRATLGVGLLAMLGCATAQVAVQPEAMAQIQRTYERTERYLKVSSYVTPFFKDSSKRFLSPTEPQFVDLLANPDGTPILPGEVERIVPAGTAVRVTKVEFPTAYVMAERVIFTPRTLVWVWLDVAEMPKGAPPHVLVLRPGIRNEQELEAELARYLAPTPLGPRLERFSDTVRAAIAGKQALPEMSAEALEMSWGPPEQKTIGFEADKHREVWSWGAGKRTAVLLDGTVTELKGQ